MKPIILLFLCLFCMTIVRAQTSIPSSGGNGTGSGGSASYTVGQVTVQTLAGSGGTVAQGVQQPYEISVVTALENTEGIILEFKVYPNPTAGLMTLIIRPLESRNFKYQLFDLNGILLQDKKVESEETEVSMQNFSSTVYILKIIMDNQEVKVFKIIKK